MVLKTKWKRKTHTGLTFLFWVAFFLRQMPFHCQNFANFSIIFRFIFPFKNPKKSRSWVLCRVKRVNINCATEDSTMYGRRWSTTRSIGDASSTHRNCVVMLAFTPSAIASYEAHHIHMNQSRPRRKHSGSLNQSSHSDRLAPSS